MKKKIVLLLLMCAMLLLIFAFSSSATQINKDTTVSIDGGLTDESGNSVTEVNLYDGDGDALIWYLDTNGRLVSAKIASLINVSDEGVISLNDQSIFNGKNAKNSVVVINLRDNVKVSGTDINFDGKIYHFDSSKGTATDVGFAATGFQFGSYNHSGSKLQYFYFPKSAKTTVKRMFQNTTVKVVDFEQGSELIKFGHLTFYNARSLKEIYIPNGIDILTGTPGEGLFENCTGLEKVIFEENSTLVNGGHSTFKNCSALKELYLPNSVRTVGMEFARGASRLETLSFGAGFKYFTMKSETADPDSNGYHMWVFYGCGNLKKVFLPATFGILDDQYNFDDLTAKDERLDHFDRVFANAGNFTLFFTGTEAEITALKTRINSTEENASLVNALKTVYSYDEYVSAGMPTGSLAVYGYSVCDAFYGSAHVEGTVIKYESYDKNGTKAVGCTRKGCNHATTEVLPAMFTSLGYSVSESGKSGIALGYAVNFGAISYFENETGVSIEYGVFAVLKDNLGDGDVFDKNGNATQGVVSVCVSNNCLQAFSIKLTGFTDGQKDIKFALGAYVKTSAEDKAEYSYLQVGDKAENEKYCFVTFNEAVDISKASKY